MADPQDIYKAGKFDEFLDRRERSPFHETDPRYLKRNAATVGNLAQWSNDGQLIDAGFSLFSLVPTGSILSYVGRTAPSGFLLCDGTTYSRTTYSTLFSLIAPTVGVFTITIASPGVGTLTAHGFNTGDPVYLTTTGALPTGLSINTIYYAIRIDADTFRLATSFANANAGTAINTSGTQSGVHTITFCPYGLGDGTTTFNVPSLKGKVPVGLDTSVSFFDALGTASGTGATTHTLTVAEMPAHTHNYDKFSAQKSGPTGSNAQSIDVAATATTSAGGGAAHNNLQPYLVVNFIIKY